MDAVLPCHSELFTAEVIARLPDRLKVIANHSVGDEVNVTAHGGSIRLRVLAIEG